MQSALAEPMSPKKYESFFCSELVAAAYKAVGLIPADQACSQFWPVNFTNKQSIEMLNGGKLEAELELRLDQV